MNQGHQKATKNPLAIRLAESVVFLRGAVEQRYPRRRSSISGEVPPGLLRGLLTLNLSKPTRISNIELILEGKSAVQWPEAPTYRHVDIAEEKVFLTASTVFFSAKSSPANARSSSVGPGTQGHYSPEEDIHHQVRAALGSTTSSSSSLPSQISGRQRRNSTEGIRTAQERQPETSYNLSHRDLPTPPTSPPYTPMYAPLELPAVDSPLDIRGESHGRPEDDPGHALEEFRNTLRMDMGGHPEGNVGHSHTSSQTHLSIPLYTPPGSRSPSRDAAFRQRHTLLSSRGNSPSASPTASGFFRISNRSHVPHESEKDTSQHRGRRHAPRWSLTSMTSVLKDRFHSASKDPEGPRGRDPNPRPTDNHDVNDGLAEEMRTNRLEDKKGPLHKLVLGLDEHSSAENWKMFGKGTYNYPISFMIPATCPPTLRCDYGTITYRLRAVAHRPGALASKLVATREVVVISAPADDDTEETHSIVVERQWDTQLRYMIALGGRSFVIGSQVPFSLTLVPMDKCKIYRLSVFLEEKIQYRVHDGDTIREQPVKRYELLSIKHQERIPQPILPLSPEYSRLLAPYIDTSLPVQSADEALSSFMGPGPWVLSHNLQLPADCTKVHFSYKHKTSNINIQHTLKIVFRVERGDQAVDRQTGRRKLFDIVVQTSIQILSCHCNTQWTTLPRYSVFEPAADGDSQASPACACTIKNTTPRLALRHPHSHTPTVTPSQSRPSTAMSERRVSGSVPGSPEAVEQSLANEHVSNNHQFARLIAGDEGILGILGDAPPDYQEATMQRHE